MKDSIDFGSMEIRIDLEIRSIPTVLGMGYFRIVGV